MKNTPLFLISTICFATVVISCSPCGGLWNFAHPTRSSQLLCEWKIATDSLELYFDRYPPGTQRDLTYTPKWQEKRNRFNKYWRRGTHRRRPLSSAAQEVYDYCIGQKKNVYRQLDYNEKCVDGDLILQELRLKTGGMGINGALEYLSDPNAPYRSEEDDLVALGRLNRLCKIIEPVPENYDRITEIDNYLLWSFNLNRSQLKNYSKSYHNLVRRKDREERNRGEEYLEVEGRLGLIYQYFDRCTQWVYNFPLLDSSITGPYTPCQWVTMNVSESTRLAREEMRALEQMSLDSSQEAKLSEYREWELQIWNELAKYCP